MYDIIVSRFTFPLRLVRNRTQSPRPHCKTTLFSGLATLLFSNLPPLSGLLFNTQIIFALKHHFGFASLPALAKHKAYSKYGKISLQTLCFE